MTNDIIDWVNKIGKDKGEQEGIVCTDMFKNETVNDIDCSKYNDDDEYNVSDKNYVFNDEEFDAELRQPTW